MKKLSLVLLLSVTLVACGSNVSAKVEEACTLIQYAKSIYWQSEFYDQFQTSTLKASQIFHEIAVDNPEYLKYAEFAGKLSNYTISSIDSDAIFGFCASY
jgi:hypothetical protein